MIGEINVGGKGGLSTEINGNINEYTAGENINAGSFVKQSGNNVLKITSSNNTILGIAKTSAKIGKTIEVYVSSL